VAPAGRHGDAHPERPRPPERYPRARRRSGGGDQHRFPDSWLPSYEAGATALLAQRVPAFLDRLG
jgi:hypothetical protein